MRRPLTAPPSSNPTHTMTLTPGEHLPLCVCVCVVIVSLRLDGRPSMCGLRTLTLVPFKLIRPVNRLCLRILLCVCVCVCVCTLVCVCVCVCARRRASKGSARKASASTASAGARGVTSARSGPEEAVTEDHPDDHDTDDALDDKGACACAVPASLCSFSASVCCCCCCRVFGAVVGVPVCCCLHRNVIV